MRVEMLARVAAVNRANEVGWGVDGDRPIVTLCSGRPQPYAEAMCRVLCNTRLPIIAEMGVWLYDPRDHAFIMDPAITAEHLEMVGLAQAWIRREFGGMGVVIQPGKTASISMLHPETTRLMELKPRLVEKFAREGWGLRVSSTVACINCDLAHVSKATGIARMMAMMGLSREKAAGIGDTMGDLAIREKVAFFACPSNADEKLKAHADYVSPHEEIEGVLDILDRLTR
jgi:hydroxymethylpyrimidine pyrophosphatase-like HAD family hydrolase